MLEINIVRGQKRIPKKRKYAKDKLIEVKINREDMESKIHVIDFKSRKGEKVFYYYLILLFKILLAVNRLN